MGMNLNDFFNWTQNLNLYSNLHINQRETKWVAYIAKVYSLIIKGIENECTYNIPIILTNVSPML